MSHGNRVRGVVLAGGTGSRLHPLTHTVNKHLLPVGRYPMICYPIAKLARAGITDVLMIAGPRDLGDLARLLGSGARWGIDLTYRCQDQPDGIAGAVALARGFAGDDPLAVLLGDNIFEADLAPFLGHFLAAGSAAHVVLKDVPDPQRYGIATVVDGRIVRIDEKPAQPGGSLCVTGIYMYRPEVFEVIARIRPSQRGELEISDVNDHFVRTGRLTHDVMSGWWCDAGTIDSLRRAGELALSVPEPVWPEAGGR